MTTVTPPLPLSLFWTLEAGCALTLALLLWLAQVVRHWPGGPAWLGAVEGSGIVRALARVLLIAAIGTVLAQMVLLTGVQLGQLSTLSFGLLTLGNLELAGLLLACLLHLVLSCLWPLHSAPPKVRPPVCRSHVQERRDRGRAQHL